MGQPKQIVFSPYKGTGVDITYVKRRQTLYVSGWYDSFVGLFDSQEITLRDFMTQLGITQSDCRKALEDSADGKS